MRLSEVNNPNTWNIQLLFINVHPPRSEGDTTFLIAEISIGAHYCPKSRFQLIKLNYILKFKTLKK